MRCINRASSLFFSKFTEILYAIPESVHRKFEPVCAGCSLVAVTFLRPRAKLLRIERAAEFVSVFRGSIRPTAGGIFPATGIAGAACSP
jgi:hypothetical protein